MITKSQLEFRKGKIGASDAASALGISPWKTKAAFWNELMGYVTPEPLGERGIIGNEIEPVIIKAYKRRTGFNVYPSPDTLIHEKYPWMICHLDGIVSGLNIGRKIRVLEIKNVGWTVAHQWGMDEDPNGVPYHVMTQCIQQAILADVESVDVAALFGGNELRVYPLTITQEAKDTVLEGLVRFWEDHVVKRVMPEVTEKDLDLLKKLYKRVNEDKVIEVQSTETALKFQDYRILKRKIKEMQWRTDLYKAQIQHFMGENTVVVRPGEPEEIEFTWKWTKDGVNIDYKGVLDDMEEMFVKGKDIRMDFPDAVKLFVWGNTKTVKGYRVFNDKSKEFKE